MKNLLYTALAGGAAIIALAGCGSHATIPAQDKQAAHELVDPCLHKVPSQIELFLPGSAGKTARESFAKCLGVPKPEREAFANAALSAAEKDHVHSMASAETFLYVTLPPLIRQYQGYGK